MKHQLIIQLTP
ncbi:hypothetical protein FWK35_00001045 [Aphis craccivora]|uniref:Uncharacterized protein n=1 Tax=Aphis craccivora TaxID=307492 RepID=A0A6G0ZPT7_APHCR|nr:hypothetical protein FWK35_00001045 [Aphis craccivora]